MRNCIIHWKSKFNDNVNGVSSSKFAEKKAKEIVEEFNKLWPELTHWYEMDSNSLNSKKPD